MRKLIHRLSGAVSFLGYAVLGYQTWQLCRAGGIRNHLPVMAAAGAVFAAGLIFWLMTGSGIWKKEKGPERKMMWIGIAAVAAVTVFFGGQILHTAVSYNGALAWKIDEWMNQRKVELTHNNFFETGAEGVLEDLDRSMDLPEDLYISNQFQMTFDGDGTIRTIYTFLYGKDEKGKIRTFLVDYDSDKGNEMTVWKDGWSDADFKDDSRLAPMLRILEQASCQKQVTEWAKSYPGSEYEILYYGRRSFDTDEGLVICPGDADGDGAEEENYQPGMLGFGGLVTGFEVSLHIPDRSGVTPVRYMMEPEYTSQSELDREEEKQQTEAAKEKDGWTVDPSNGSMRFFLNDRTGWCLTVVDAAAGSRAYSMEKTTDGGESWETVNENPFDGNIGVAEGIRFFDENFGFAALTGASQSHSEIYMTNDGGKTFTQISLPFDTVTELPEHADEYGLTLEDYAYLNMPEKEGNVLKITAMSAAGEEEGIRFRSEDNGATWIYDGVVQ